MESLAFLFLIISGVHAWGDMQCSGADVCEDPTVLDLTEDELAISLLQRRAFLERPQVDVEDGMLVAVHSVIAMSDMKTEELEHKHEAAESSAEFSAPNSTAEKAPKPPAAESAVGRAATVAAPADRRLSLVETRSDPTLDVVKSAIAGIQHNKSNIAGGVQMAASSNAASSNASAVNDTDDNSTIKLNLNLGGAPHNVEEKLQEAENVSRVEMKTLATLIVEAIILFVHLNFCERFRVPAARRIARQLFVRLVMVVFNALQRLCRRL